MGSHPSSQEASAAVVAVSDLLAAEATASEDSEAAVSAVEALVAAGNHVSENKVRIIGLSTRWTCKKNTDSMSIGLQLESKTIVDKTSKKVRAYSIENKGNATNKNYNT